MLSFAPCASGPALAQIGGPPGAPSAPLNPPPPPPGAAAQAVPGAPAATSTTGALPQLAPAPRVVQAPQAIASAQVFRCSCFGTGLGTQWVGVVQSSSYTLADQSAQMQCLAYNLNTNVGSPYIQTPGFGFTKSPYPAVNPNVPPGSVINPYAGGLTPPPGFFLPGSVQRFGLTAFCSRCACN